MAVDVAELEIRVTDTGTAAADANLVKLEQSEKRVVAAGGPLERTFREIREAATGLSTTSDRLNARFAQLAAATAQSNARLVEGVRAAQAIGAGLANLSGALGSTAAASTRAAAASGTLRGALSGVRTAVQDAGGSFSRLGASIIVANQAFALIGQVSRGVATVVRALVQPAIEFETAWTGVRKTVTGSEQELRGLQVRLAGLNATLPLSTREVLGVAEAAGQLGIQTPAIADFTRTMVQLGATTNLSASEAATSLARLANITQLPQDQFDRLGSTIVALGNNLATTEQEIVAMALRIAGAGNQVGLSEAQILSFAATLSSLGIEAEAGGTAISRIFIEIAKAVETGNASLQTFATVAGTSTEGFARSFRENAAQATQQFIAGLTAIEDQGGSTIQVLEQLSLGDIRVGDALRRAAGGGDLLARSLELGSRAWEENSALTAEAEQRFATVASQLTLLGKDVEELATKFGTKLLPDLKETIGATRDLVNIFDDAADLAGSGFALGLQAINNYLTTMLGLMQGIRDVTPDLSWLFSDSPGAQDFRTRNFTIDVGQYNSRDAAEAVRRQRRLGEEGIGTQRAAERALRLSEDPFLYGQSLVPFPGLGEGERTAPFPRTAATDPNLFRRDARPYDNAGYDYMQEDVGPFAPGDYRYKPPKPDRAAGRAANLAERSAVAFGDAAVIGAETQTDAAERQLALLQEQFEVAERLAATDLQRLAVLDESATQQIAAARALDAFRQQELDTQIAVLQTRQQGADVTAGERAELDAQIAQLEQQRDLIAASGGEAAKLTREFEAQRDAITQGLLEQAQSVRDTVLPMEAVTREMEKWRTLIAEMPELGSVLTPEVLEAHEANLTKAASGANDTFDDLIDAARGFGQDFSRTMAEALSPDGARISFRDFLSSLITDVNEFVIQKTLTDPILGLVEESIIKPIQGKTGERSLPGFLGDLGGGAFDALFGGGSSKPPAIDPSDIGAVGDVQALALFATTAEDAGDAMLRAAQTTEAGFGGIINTIGGGFTDLFGNLGGALSSLFDSLFGENGFDIGGFFIGLAGKALGGLAGGLTGGGGGGELVGPPQADGTFHRGGIAHLFHQGGIRLGEVPAILEEGEMVLSRGLTRELLATARRGPEVRRYHSGGLVERGGADLAPLAEITTPATVRDRGVSGGGGRGGGRGGDSYHFVINQNAQSLDPRTTAQLLQQQSTTIVGIIRKDIAKGGGLSRDVGQRD